VTTRLLILESPAERVTLSIYGFSPTADQKPILTPHLHTAVELEKEDWGWLHSWAGGIPSLLDLLNDDTPPSTRDKALDTLDLFTDIETILPQILDHPTALPFLLSLPSYPAQPLLYRLYADPTYALHPNLRHHLPHSHSLKKLVQGGRKEAWGNLRLGRGALAILAEGSGEDLLAIRKGTGRSNLSSLMEHTQLSATGDDQESRRSLELALDILDTPSLYDDPIAISYLAQPLPGLAVISRTRGSKRMLNIPSSRNRQVVKSLLEESTATVDGQSRWPAASALAQPYLEQLNPSDPLRTAFTDSQRDQADLSSPFPDTLDGRRLSRLSHGLSRSSRSPADSVPPQVAISSIHHESTPAELLSIIAPHLLQTISTAPIPPLGIPSILNPTPESQASAWAGKVYSSHEFRDREREREKENMGRGIAAGLGRGLSAGRVGIMGAAMGARPASRHVDEYA